MAAPTTTEMVRTEGPGIAGFEEQLAREAGFQVGKPIDVKESGSTADEFGVQLVVRGPLQVVARVLD